MSYILIALRECEHRDSSAFCERICEGGSTSATRRIIATDFAKTIFGCTRLQVVLSDHQRQLLLWPTFRPRTKPLFFKKKLELESTKAPIRRFYVEMLTSDQNAGAVITILV
jgi:hypothetical protein